MVAGKALEVPHRAAVVENPIAELLPLSDLVEWG